jgi:hypothetical protein
VPYAGENIDGGGPGTPPHRPATNSLPSLVEGGRDGQGQGRRSCDHLGEEDGVGERSGQSGPAYCQCRAARLVHPGVLQIDVPLLLSSMAPAASLPWAATWTVSCGYVDAKPYSAGDWKELIGRLGSLDAALGAQSKK